MPDQADCYSNLGIVLQSTGRLDAAIDAYRRAIAIDPNHANAHSNLGVLLRATGRPADAEAAYRTAIRLNPEHIDAYTNLGILLNGLRRTEEAAACYLPGDHAAAEAPRSAPAAGAGALHPGRIGRRRWCILEEWLAEEPGDPIALHMLAACTGRDVPARASNAFVERTFDSFADSFESKLEQLSYRAPALVAEMLRGVGRRAVEEPRRPRCRLRHRAVRPARRPYARRLIGVDLSAGMLVHAEDKHVYDALVNAELTEYLGRPSRSVRRDRVCRYARLFRRA